MMSIINKKGLNHLGKQRFSFAVNIVHHAIKDQIIFRYKP